MESSCPRLSGRLHDGQSDNEFGFLIFMTISLTRDHIKEKCLLSSIAQQRKNQCPWVDMISYYPSQYEIVDGSTQTAHRSIGLLAILTCMNHLKTGTTTHMSRLSGRVNDGGPASRHCAYGPRRTKNID